MCSSCQHGASSEMFIDACTFPLWIFHLVSISFAIPWTSSLFVYYSVTIWSLDSDLFHSMSFLGVKEQARWLQFLVGATYFCWPDSFRSILSSWACSTILSTNRVLERPALGIWYGWYRIYAFDSVSRIQRHVLQPTRRKNVVHLGHRQPSTASWQLRAIRSRPESRDGRIGHQIEGVWDSPWSSWI